MWPLNGVPASSRASADFVAVEKTCYASWQFGSRPHPPIRPFCHEIYERSQILTSTQSSSDGRIATPPQACIQSWQSRVHGVAIPDLLWCSCNSWTESLKKVYSTVCPKVPYISKACLFSAVCGWIPKPSDLLIATAGRFVLVYEGAWLLTNWP